MAEGPANSNARTEPLPIGELWMLVRLSLPTNPKIYEIAGRCGCSANEALGAVVRVWTWAQDQAHEDGSIPHGGRAMVDGVGQLPGLGDAFAAVGWLQDLEVGGVVLRYWDRFNGKVGRKRARKRVAKRAERERKADAGSVEGAGVASEHTTHDGGQRHEGDIAATARRHDGDARATSRRPHRGEGKGEREEPERKNPPGGVHREARTSGDRLADAIEAWASMDGSDARSLLPAMSGLISELMTRPLPTPEDREEPRVVLALAIEDAIKCGKPPQGASGAKKYIGSILHRCWRERRLPGEWKPRLAGGSA